MNPFIVFILIVIAALIGGQFVKILAFLDFLAGCIGIRFILLLIILAAMILFLCKLVN